MRAKFFLMLLAVLMPSAVWLLQAQSPAPVVVQAQTATAAAAPAAQPSPAANDSVQSAIKLLEEVRVANEETLKKQQAILERLDELQKAAEQIKVFAKRT